jgi:hypothetical protein
MRLRLCLSVGAAAAALITLAAAEPDDGVLEVGAFSRATAGGLPPAWVALTFPKIRHPTHYALAPDDGRVVVRAEANASASALITNVQIDPHAYPIIRWRWKIGNLIERADLARKEGDDYPARVYVNFRDEHAELSFFEKVEAAVYRKRYGQEPPTATLNYIWDGKAPAGTIAPNAYTDRVRMFVVKSGAQSLGRWVEEERNLLDDYRAAFGKDPPPIVSVAIMTDTDDTGESAVAWYGDIAFGKSIAR